MGAKPVLPCRECARKTKMTDPDTFSGLRNPVNHGFFGHRWHAIPTEGILSSAVGTRRRLES